MDAESAAAAALRGLEAALHPPRPGTPLGNWRWQVRQQASAVRDALVNADIAAQGTDGWLCARQTQVSRERGTLLDRLARLGNEALEQHDIGIIRRDAHQLVLDVTHHLQRVHDLAYDEVEMELGGEQ